MLEKDEKGYVNINQQVEKVVRQLLKKIRNEDDDFNAEDYFADKSEFTSSTSLNVYITEGNFQFEQEDTDWLFARQGSDHQFDGATEIEKVGNDLNSRYPAELGRAFFRDELVDRIYNIVYNPENTPLVIIGPEGVGKHTLLHEVLRRYMDLYFKGNDIEVQKIWHIDPTRIIAGMKYVGWWQKRFEAILRYVRDRHLQHAKKKDSASDKIMIDNVVSLLRIGKSSQNSMTLSDVLKPYLEKRQLQLILIATFEEWKILQEKDRRFSDLFQVVRVQEPNHESAIKMVLKQRHYLEIEYDCEFTIQAIKQLFAIQRNYLHRKALPGSILKLMNQLAVKYRSQNIDLPEVRDEFESFSGLNEIIFDADYTFEENEVHDAIAAQLVGQPDAVATLADAIHTIKAKLTDPTKPLASFLFIGPTGVGKTQAAKVLCDYLMGNPKHLLRFDMNEYIDAQAVHRLIGDEHNPEGHLTGKVRYRPFGIILFDEIEKAHPKVHDLLLQVLDDGRLTDSLGKTVDFSGNIIIMTSNVGAREAAGQLGFVAGQRDDSAVYRKAVENRFRPEFVNRIDRIVIFRSLEVDHILNIARLQIKDLLKRDGFVRRTTILNISTEALEWVARRGYNAKMGGRALKRQIEKDLTTLSAEQLISTHTDNPIIFSILFKEGQLVPRIIPLDFVEPIEEDWLPQLPEEARGRGFFNRLLKLVERLEYQVRRMEEENDEADSELIVIGNDAGEALNWQYYHFKDQIAATKQRISTLSLGFKEKHFREGPAIPLRLKRGTVTPRRDSVTRSIKESIRDRLFQQEALHEITEYYEYASAQFDSLETEFINSYLDVGFLLLFGKGFLREEVETIELHFQSCINGLGDQEIEFLMQHYNELLSELDIQHQIEAQEKWIRIEGHSVASLFMGETGIHLFYRSHQNPLPILVHMIKLPRTKPEQLSIPDGARVIRIYDSNSTLTDLRSGFSNAMNISARELKLLLFSGLPKAFRDSVRQKFS
ncbi:MAG: AAA family ATPase [Bacteroidota bacterium]